VLLGAAAAGPAAWLLSACNGTSGPGSGGGNAKASALTMSDWWGGQFKQYLPIQQAKDKIKIKEQLYSYDNGIKLTTQLTSGTAPDVFLTDAGWNGNLFTHKGYLATFDEQLKKRKIDMSKWDVDPHKETGFDGKILALSVMVTQDQCVMVNKQLADDEGLLKDLPLYGTPTYDTWKWDKYVDWLKAATKIQSNGKVERYGAGNVPVAVLFQTLLTDLGGQYFDDIWNYDETKCLLDSDAAIEAAQLVGDLFIKHKVAPPSAVEQAIRGGSYLSKRAVSTMQWTTPSAYPETGNFPMAYFALPFVDRRVHALGANQLCVNNSTKYRDAALDWVITFCTDPDVRAKFLQVSSVPAYDPVPIVKAAPEGTPKTLALINLSRIKGMSLVPEDATDVATYPRWVGRYASTATQTAVQAALDQVTLGKASAKDAFTKATEQINAKIAQGRRAAGK
jgi:ABC-type glycerol-3-phosphate transport system substrate-binding protein